MCSQFIVSNSADSLAKSFKAIQRTIAPGWRVVPGRPGPVIVETANGRTLFEKLFGLVPAWSHTPKVKFATHNARLYSVEEKTKREIPITEKPTWRDPFKKRHCLVPMTGFIEPIYSGDLAGNMVVFRPREVEVLLAAGLWEDWVSKEGGETRSTFTILTDNPVTEIERMGHDRTPIFLGGEKAFEWLKPESKSPTEWIHYLRSNPVKMTWSGTVDRPMAPGWEKRI